MDEQELILDKLTTILMKMINIKSHRLDGFPWEHCNATWEYIDLDPTQMYNGFIRNNR